MTTATVDDRGRILLPPMVRQTLGLEPGDLVGFVLHPRLTYEARPGALIVKVEVPVRAQG